MNEYILINPTTEIVNQYDRIWKGNQNKEDYRIKLFDHICIDIRDYYNLKMIKSFGEQDRMIDDYRKKNDVDMFFAKLNTVYHTRLNTKGIAEAWSSAGWTLLPDTTMTPDTLIELCKQKTGSYAYSFSSKVFSFIDPDTYPIMDKYVVNMLRAYGIKGISTWGDYKKYIEAYNEFRKKFKLDTLSYKKIDQFLWTYANLLERYWEKEGVIFFNNTVSYKSKTNNKEI